MKSTLLQTCHNQLTPYLDHDWAIGLSGGCDSVVLYHLIKSAFPQKPLTVIHINHQVQKQANEWETFCENLVTCTDDRFYARRIECTKESEEHFREKRFEAFELQLLELKENC
ncbi:MAG: hypothetical protein FJ161_04740, partial [Gammaproteobacteria bacterium]|nr:hypothetical protein [Gammaproteobacteria bacterium]